MHAPIPAMTIRRLGAPAIALALLVGCGGEGELEGSISDVYRLGHDDVRARLYESALSIEYTRDNGSVPVRVSLRLDDVSPSGGDTYDLGEHGSITGQLADGTSIPPFIDGKLTLDSYKARDGAEVAGSFTGTFDGVRDTLNLRGDFDTTLELVDWPKAPEMPDDPQEPGGSMTGDAGP